MPQVNCRERKIDGRQDNSIGKDDDVARPCRGATAAPATEVNLLGLKPPSLTARCGVTADAQARAIMLRSIVGMRTISSLLVVYDICTFTRMH